ncbi:MAG: proline--tRNA ligase, partial [Candidatus Phytoplasma australasiaticum]|nr:proline--tRNA ligase [Candidatus Phytoplasma australasiaticum]
MTPRDVNFGKWYNDICLKSELISFSDIKGFIIYLPDSYFIWEQIQKFLNKKLKQINHQNVYFPFILSEKYFQKEKKHISGFSPETIKLSLPGKNNSISENFIIRPTSEVIFSQYYSKIINTYKDLPKLYNQWCNVIRWEKSTKPFLRGREFLWQEGHTIHSDKKDALDETLFILEIYKKLFKKILAIPFVCGKKTELEKFAGSKFTYSLETLMYDGQSLQTATSHYLGKNFAKSFNIKFKDRENNYKFVYQTSWGISTRLLGAIIMVHGDDKGLVIPPYIAPIQIVIIPLNIKNKKIIEKSFFLFNMLNEKYRVFLDMSDKGVGWKFNQYEIKGVPLRLEIGETELKEEKILIFTRYNLKKEIMKIDEFISNISFLLKNIHKKMYEKAQ